MYAQMQLMQIMQTHWGSYYVKWQTMDMLLEMRKINVQYARANVMSHACIKSLISHQENVGIWPIFCC